MFKATVYVTIKENVLDPQGTAVQGALHTMGFDDVERVRIGKYMEIDLNTADRAEAESRLKAMCEKLLANTVVEDYRFELTEHVKEGV
ncbi:phosphoribosylformylglycinamidine synthase subunit PurS [Xylanibacillus composti]|uniref:Phosphoribosylformylglycinamidine synthase subunit PurS n=1 Tax=Xylanibacillus composti TaxID=1572762 RepID=A0A8J4H7S8_9BACL|nr:phosphoribosylformylglycinamidine synthase subunit PurS [Xylanibacillus composti]MDT9725912.1 phosphoribosylformylglycinamidine synthase subunit PurS [Xylanibacillus composti]GIQ70418.1 phosphoribosylformylglycinamidine synthase subunit PurS [Xylanibacillus composti]